MSIVVTGSDRRNANSGTVCSELVKLILGFGYSYFGERTVERLQIEGSKGGGKGRGRVVVSIKVVEEPRDSRD